MGWCKFAPAQKNVFTNLALPDTQQPKNNK